MGNIKLVAWEVYSTLIAPFSSETSDCGEDKLMARAGALEALAAIKERGISQITISDGDLAELRKNLHEAGIPRDFFDDLYGMEPWQEKDMSLILKKYGLDYSQALVIGDNYEIYIGLAQRQGCRTLWASVSEGLVSPLPVRDILAIIS
ncbi:MAG: HAD hydrolase-like protein [Nanoarchaeota archaeon]|nr:HAD hydrolase-like protein [Nanoarchaeota archaeon]